MVLSCCSSPESGNRLNIRHKTYAGAPELPQVAWHLHMALACHWSRLTLLHNLHDCLGQPSAPCHAYACVWPPPHCRPLGEAHFIRLYK
ncbi:hypothetical protein DdX_13323 [Ditylenchus destructor]|uniref:Uncharacterized protein n=1 Tax=Ditylenchus destructor TaxID=166010 RepID=A0AAD4MZ17_9BILA|nr:hypothetical protein DdX_19661 [Ditylenchus destructor]KAI1705886.1 hypothetical protein DdX_13323 [Ditylenchus destructor]